MKKISILYFLIISLLMSCGKKKEPKKALIEDDIVAVKLVDVSQANSTKCSTWTLTLASKCAAFAT